MNDQKILWDKEYQQNLEKWRLDTKALPNTMKNKKVLELGVGNGKTLRAILKQRPLKVTAIDFSTESIKKSKADFKEDNVEFIQGEVTNLPIKDKELDIIICYYILNNLLESQRKNAIREMKRVLKGNGKIIFEDFAVGDFRNKDGKTIEKNTLRKKNGLICHFFNIKELRALFKDFKRVRFTKKNSQPITHKPKLRRQIISGTIN